MVHVQLTDDDAATLRGILQAKLVDLAKEINRTDHLDLKQDLKRMERALDELMRQLR